MANNPLRAGRASDAAALLDVHRSSILELGRQAYSEAECESWAAGLVPERYIEAMTTGGETYFVIEDGDSVCGFCSFREDEVVGLYVHPRAFRTGAGSTLLSQAEKAIAETGVSTIRIRAALSALSFYRKHGYHIVQRKKWKTRGGVEIDVCAMEKHLMRD